MEWMVVIFSILIILVASLFKIVYRSHSPSEATFLENGKSVQKKKVLLVIAHPDDESMFFTPTVNYLISRGHDLHLLCMSTGNADGLGNIRKEELYKAAAVLKVPVQHVKVVDHPDLQDGFGKVWDCNLLASLIEAEILTHAIDVIITFDSYGVSGHCNHRDVNHGVRKILNEDSARNIEAWELVSTNILRKYSGPVDIWLSSVYAMLHSERHMHCLLNEHPSRSYAAMAQHMSQWVWFRKLFVSLSSYTYVNTLKKIEK